ncbi:MAG: trehalose-phosphatase [Xanthobacteraceae bacterium]
MPVSERIETLAVFLDIDGTLLDIAPSPQAVIVPAGLIDALMRLHDSLAGALAFVSGRPLVEIDRLFAPMHIPAAAEHGAVVRLPDGKVEEANIAVPKAWRTALKQLAAQHPGIFIEEKAHSIVTHYRLAPDAEPIVRQAVHQIAAGALDRFDVLPARMAYELCGRDVAKGAAVRRLMRIPPFAGRKPIYVGDDATDEPAIAAVQETGGLGFHVARDFNGQPERVRAWIRSLVEPPARTAADSGTTGLAR